MGPENKYSTLENKKRIPDQHNSIQAAFPVPLASWLRMILPGTLSRMTSWSTRGEAEEVEDEATSVPAWASLLTKASGFRPFQMCSAYQAGSKTSGS